jgi:hypothetical protein
MHRLPARLLARRIMGARMSAFLLNIVYSLGTICLCAGLPCNNRRERVLCAARAAPALALSVCKVSVLLGLLKMASQRLIYKSQNFLLATV